MRKIYDYLSKEEKEKALELLLFDIKLLEKELHSEYPRVVKDAIAEALMRYQKEADLLGEELRNN